jgi:hypothetical protein
MAKKSSAPATPTVALKTIPAIELVRNEPFRALHVEFRGEAYSGIRVSSRSRGQPRQLELSAIRGVVGDSRTVVLAIAPETLVQVRA